MKMAQWASLSPLSQMVVISNPTLQTWAQKSGWMLQNNTEGVNNTLSEVSKLSGDLRLKSCLPLRAMLKGHMWGNRSTRKKHTKDTHANSALTVLGVRSLQFRGRLGESSPVEMQSCKYLASLEPSLFPQGYKRSDLEIQGKLSWLSMLLPL